MLKTCFLLCWFIALHLPLFCSAHDVYGEQREKHIHNHDQHRLLTTQLAGSWSLFSFTSFEQAITEATSRLSFVPQQVSSNHLNLYAAYHSVRESVRESVWKVVTGQKSSAPAISSTPIIGNHGAFCRIGNDLAETLGLICTALRKEGPVLSRHKEGSTVSLSKVFLIHREGDGGYQELSQYLNLPKKQKNNPELNKAIRQLQKETGTSDLKDILHTSEATLDSRRTGILVTPFNRDELTDTTPAQANRIIYNRLYQNLVVDNWKREIIIHTLKGSLAGAAIESTTTLLEKILGEGQPFNAVQTEILKAALHGAFLGGSSSALNWSLIYYGLPLWLSAPVTTASLHLLQETAMIALGQSETDGQALLWSIPASMAYSLGAYAGELWTPIPLAGSITGAVVTNIIIRQMSALYH